jgi:hypothetical protein
VEAQKGAEDASFKREMAEQMRLLAALDAPPINLLYTLQVSKRER